MAIKLAGVQLGNISGGPSSITLEDLADVSVVSPQTGQYLRYNSGISEWQNSYLNTDIWNYLSTYMTGTNGINLVYTSPQSISVGLTLTASGDASGTVSSGNLPLTLANVNSNVGTFGSASAIPQITVNSKGLITAVTSIPFGGTAALATSLAGGSTGALPYQSATNTTSFLAAGTTSQVLVGGATAPSWNNSPAINGTNFTNIPNSALSNSSIILGSTSIPLGSTTTTITGLSSVSSTAFVGGLTGHASLDLSLGGGSMTGTITMDGTHTVTGLPNPVNGSDAASKNYVDAALTGLEWKLSAMASTTANLNATYSNGTSGVGATLTNAGTQAAFSTDGYTASFNDRILVKNQTNQIQNGIYQVTTVGDTATNWVLTRTSDANTSSLLNNATLYITNGTLLSDTGWTQLTTNAVIGTSNITFSQFSGAGTYVAGVGLSLTGNSFANTGVLSVTTNTGLSTNVSATGAVTITNTGVTSNLAGTGISISGATGASTITNTGVTSNLAGTGISISGATGASTITNTGVTSFTSGTGLSTNTSATGAVSVTNTGVTSNLAGAGISVSSATGAVTITNLGVTSLTTNTGLSTNTSATGAVTITNTGVTSNLAGTGISISGATGASTITNTGVTSIVAGSNISVSGSTGAVTISTSGTVPAATTATNIAGGTSNSIPYQTAANNTTFLAQGTGVLQEIAGAPSWTTTPTLTGTNFSGIPNSALTNNSVTIGSTNVALGATATTLAGLTSVTSTTFVGALTGVASSATNIAGGAANSIPYQTGANTTTFLSQGTGVLTESAGAPIWSTTPALTGTNFTGIPNSALTNNSVTIGSTNVALGAISTSLAGLTSIGINGVGLHYSSVLTTSSTTANQVLDASLAITSYRSVKYQISITSGSLYEYTEVTIIQDGTNVYMTENNTLVSSSTLATFTAAISGGNLQLLTTPSNAVTVYKVIATAIVV